MTDAELEAEVQRVAAELRLTNVWVSFDGRVKAPVAAMLCDIGESALKKRRSEGRPPFPVYRGRSVTYRIRDCIATMAYERAA